MVPCPLFRSKAITPATDKPSRKKQRTDRAAAVLPFPFSQRDVLSHIISFVETASSMKLGLASKACRTAVDAACTRLKVGNYRCSLRETGSLPRKLAKRFPSLSALDLRVKGTGSKVAKRKISVMLDQVVANRLSVLCVDESKDDGACLAPLFLARQWPLLKELRGPAQFITQVAAEAGNKLRSVEILGCRDPSALAQAIQVCDLSSLKQVRGRFQTRTTENVTDLVHVLQQARETTELDLDIRGAMHDMPEAFIALAQVEIPRAVRERHIFSSLR